MIKIYDTKPCQIEAIQFTRENIEEVKNFCGDDICYDFTIRVEEDELSSCWIHTLEGEMLATENDYIIKGLKGEFYPCKPDVFEKKYEEHKNEISMGTLYDINKQAVAYEIPLSDEELNEELGLVTAYIKNNKQYFMLLNNDKHDYTLFNLSNMPTKNKIINAVQDFKECLINRGKIIGIEKSDVSDALEIWIKDYSNGIFCYYFFAYDNAVIEE
jgi:hypothetical protein